jgi:hypothetical protein
MNGAGAHDPEIDHLARLFLAGHDDWSSGSYLPSGFDLRQTGADQVVDRIVHTHEANHSILNAGTAWGAALHITARVPSWRKLLFHPLLDVCRTVHETYATFISVNIVSARHSGAEQALAAYTAYEPLYRIADHVIGGVTGPCRRELAMSALARICMQTPILSQLLEGPIEDFRISRIRSIDRPDARWHWLLRHDVADLMRSAGDKADDRVAGRFGPSALHDDVLGADPELAANDRFDDAWALWEATVFLELGHVLEGSGARIRGEGEHLPEANELARIACSRQEGLELSFQAGTLPPSMSWRLAAAVTRHGRHWFAAERIASQLATAGQDVDLDEVARVVDATCRLDGTPSLVVSVRLARRLTDGFRFDDAGQRLLDTHPAAPVAAVRATADDGTGSDVLWHVRLPAPEQLSELADQWNERGPALCCVAASCFIDEEWQNNWLPGLTEIGPLIVLLDVGLEAVSDSWSAAGGVIEGFYIPLSGSHGDRYAVALTPPGQPALWVAVADYTGIELLVSQLDEIDGIDLRLEGADWSGWIPAVRLALVHLFATESFVDFNALAGYPWAQE